MNTNTAALLDATFVPGVEVSVSQSEAVTLGAFQEDALSYQDAKESAEKTNNE
jgi:hypothetical protein